MQGQVQTSASLAAGILCFFNHRTQAQSTPKETYRRNRLTLLRGVLTMPMTYATLTGPKTTPGSIRSWVNYDRLDIDQILEEAQTTIFGRLRVREMRSLDCPRIAAGDHQAPLPPRMLEARALRSADNFCFEMRSAADLLERRVYDASGTLADGPPQYFAVF